MSTIKLQSGPSFAEILPSRGALISKLRFADGDDVLWLPKNFDPTASSWPGGGLPFLFPFAGRVRHQGELYKYAVEGHVFSMPLHGFSWASHWTLISSTKNSATLKLASSELTKANYPYEFELKMTMTLDETSLLVVVHITHQQFSKKTTMSHMPVAVGWHPYFALLEQTGRLTIPAKTAFAVTQEGMAGPSMPVEGHLGKMPWVLPKSELQSLILGDLDQSFAEIKRARDTVLLKTTPTDVMKYVVTWTNEPQSFICVEPWMSKPDAVAHPTGCRWLAPGESLSVQLAISKA
jgi:galactose mutarotase-like enzyme